MDRTFFMAASGLCLLLGGVVSVELADQVPGTTEATSKLHGCPQVPTALQIPFEACYVHESKVILLMAQISAVLKTLNLEKDFTKSVQDELGKLPKVGESVICSNEKIQLLTHELVWITQQVWKLSNWLQEPADAQVEMITKREIDLIRHLSNLTVYAGDSPASGMQLVSFNTQVDLLDAGFKKALAALGAQRPIRNNVESILASIKSQSAFRAKEKRTRSTILDPSKTVAELIQLSKSGPEEMSEALPQLISNRYAGKLGNAQTVLDLIKQLPNVVHQMIGYASLYDAMKANSDLESYELTELVVQLRGMNASVTSDAADISPPVLTKYTQLVDDVWPVYQVVGRNTTCDFNNFKYNRSMNGWGGINSLYPEQGIRSYWRVHPIPGTAKFAIISTGPTRNQIYSSATETFSSSKRSVKDRSPSVPELFAEWKFVPVQGGKYFRILNAMHDEVLFADNTEMNPYQANFRLIFLRRHDYSGVHDFELNADLWTIACW